jgi:hypothetical protein
MTHTSHKSHLWLWLVLGMLLVLAVLTLWHRWYWFFPNRAASSVYVKYHGTDGLKVAFVKDFPLNDTVSIDVTLLQATTGPAWQRLKDDFGYLSHDQEYEDKRGNIDYKFSPKKNYSQPMDQSCFLNNDGIVFSHKEKIICVFHFCRQFQREAFLDWQFNAMINDTTLSNINNNEDNN